MPQKSAVVMIMMLIRMMMMMMMISILDYDDGVEAKDVGHIS